ECVFWRAPQTTSRFSRLTTPPYSFVPPMSSPSANDVLIRPPCQCGAMLAYVAVSPGSSVRCRSARLQRKWRVDVLGWPDIQTEPALHVEWRLTFRWALTQIGSVWQQETRIGGIAQVGG